MAKSPCILFTAFEPSGDALAAPVIAELKRRRPQLRIAALGGPKMKEAGAEIIEETTRHAVMLVGAVAQAWSHHQRVKRLTAWLRQNPILALVPTDSPAANWGICEAVRRTQPGAAIVHLAAPQLWAWGTWRIKKMRKLSDHALALLPFEQPWFSQRGVPATFVGHPVFNRPPSAPEECDLSDLPSGGPKLALLPGSRKSEIKQNWPTMYRAFVRLRERHPNLQGLIAAAHDDAAKLVTKITCAMARSDSLPEGLSMVTHQADRVMAWSDIVLAVSGTATLQVVSHKKPIVVLYNTHYLSWKLVGQFVIKTRTFTLPNLIAQTSLAHADAALFAADPRRRHIVPEFVPHFGAVDPIVEAVDRLVTDDQSRQRQVRAMRLIGELFAQTSFASTAASKIIELAERRA